VRRPFNKHSSRAGHLLRHHRAASGYDAKLFQQPPIGGPSSFTAGGRACFLTEPVVARVHSVTTPGSKATALSQGSLGVLNITLYTHHQARSRVLDEALQTQLAGGRDEGGP